jgi:hypothetical protein
MHLIEHLIICWFSSSQEQLVFFWNIADDDNMSDKISCNLELYTSLFIKKKIRPTTYLKIHIEGEYITLDSV